MRRTLRAAALMVATAFRADPWRALGIFVLSITSALLSVLIAYWLQLLADGALRDDSRMVTIAAVALAATGLVNSVIVWHGFNIRTVLIERTGLVVDQRIVELTAGLHGLEHFERPDYLNELEMLRLERDILSRSVAAIVQAVGVAVQSVGTALLLAKVHPLLLLLPVFGLASVWAGSRAERRSQAALESTVETERVSRHLFELATSPGPGKELRIFGLGNELVSRHRDLWAQVDRGRTRASMRGAVTSAVGWLIFAVGFVGAIGFVGLRAVNGQASPGEVLMALTLAGQVNRQLEGAVFVVQFLFHTLKVTGRLLWLIEYASGARPKTKPSGVVPERIADGIAFEGVTFRYPGTDRDVLSNVSLRIPAGATLAVVGENGAGKSTLVKLLCRFYEPTLGRVTVDGTDLRELEVDAWRLRLSAGFQDFAHFELLARETVGVGDLPRIDQVAGVEAALVRAGASDVPADLPSGLDTQVGRSFEGGVELSGGQWQKLALGRAMMREAPLVLVLDEPTASLDAETEHALFEQYAGAARRAAAVNGAITVLVSHRFSTVRMADVIVVVSEGRVVESGSHDELVSRGGLYAELYELQARSYR